MASLPKVGAVAVLVRLVSLATPDNRMIASSPELPGGGIDALREPARLNAKGLKRLLGFSGIAHAGYALIGFVALDGAGYTAALYYMVAYVLMVLACMLVICRVSVNGSNATLDDLAGLHRRSPLLALTLVVGVFALAGVPPFPGFMGKLSLLKAALAKGHLALVIIAVLNTAIAIYYYLSIVREACFRDSTRPAILLPGSGTRGLRALARRDPHSRSRAPVRLRDHLRLLCVHERAAWLRPQPPPLSRSSYGKLLLTFRPAPAIARGPRIHRAFRGRFRGRHVTGRRPIRRPGFSLRLRHSHHPGFSVGNPRPSGLARGGERLPTLLWGSGHHHAGDHPYVLVAMNPAALKVSLPDLQPGGIIIINVGRIHSRQPDQGAVCRIAPSKTDPSRGTALSRQRWRR